jgi:hypothetical protein
VAIASGFSVALSVSKWTPSITYFTAGAGAAALAGIGAGAAAFGAGAGGGAVVFVAVLQPTSVNVSAAAVAIVFFMGLIMSIPLNFQIFLVAVGSVGSPA